MSVSTHRPTVSVVIPVHNGMPHLPETLQSVLDQTLAPDEIIVLENGSTDGTAEWLAAHAPDGVRVVKQDQLVDAAKNWTDAIELTSGDYVKLLCADDLLAPTALQEQSELMTQHSRAVLVACTRSVIDDDGRVVVRNRGLSGLTGEIEGRDAVRRCCLFGSNLFGEPATVLFRRDALVQCLPWDATWPYVIDLQMYGRVLQLGTLVAHRTPLATFRMAHGSWSAALADVQVKNIDSWVRSVVTFDLAELNRWSRLRSWAGVRWQNTLRQAAYLATRRRARRVVA